MGNGREEADQRCTQPACWWRCGTTWEAFGTKRWEEERFLFVSGQGQEAAMAAAIGGAAAAAAPPVPASATGLVLGGPGRRGTRRGAANILAQLRHAQLCGRGLTRGAQVLWGWGRLVREGRVGDEAPRACRVRCSGGCAESRKGAAEAEPRSSSGTEVGVAGSPLQRQQ